MPKKKPVPSQPFTAAAYKRLPAGLEFDAKCKRYILAQVELELLQKELYALARRNGVALKDAPRSRLLAGVEFEALASLATRTEVDQQAAAKAHRRSDVLEGSIDLTAWYVLNPNWERELAKFDPTLQRHFRARVLACLRIRPVKRLTVRKRKSVAARAARRAAA